MIAIRVQPLSQTAFAPFGQVIEADPARMVKINAGRTMRFDGLAVPDCDKDGRAQISIFRGTPWGDPIRIAMVERHPLGSQAFMPLQQRDWLVVVALHPAPGACRAFRARGDQGVQIARGVWHHPLVVLAGPQDFLVIDRGGPGDNLEEHHFTPDEVAVIEWPRQAARRELP